MLPTELRSLDTVHIATAGRIGADLAEIVTRSAFLPVECIAGEIGQPTGELGSSQLASGRWI
jgi:hypothetical protein